jgi:pilus assembly protein Flp/PilA
MMKLLKKLCRKEEGATMVEYGLMVALIALACMATVTTMGTNLNTLFGQIASKLTATG